MGYGLKGIRGIGGIRVRDNIKTLNLLSSRLRLLSSGFHLVSRRFSRSYALIYADIPIEYAITRIDIHLRINPCKSTEIALLSLVVRPLL